MMRQLYYAIQSLIRGRSFIVIKVISLTLGLFVGILLFACVAFQLSFNRCFQKPEQLYLAYMSDTMNKTTSSGDPYIYGPFSAALKENFPKEVEDATILREVGTNVFYNGDVRLLEEMIYGDQHLFSTLGLQVLAGKSEDLINSDALFVSRSFARKIGAGDTLSSVIGKTLYIDRKKPMIIRGVFEDLPENTDLSFSVVAPMAELWNRKRAGWGFDISYKSIIRFRDKQAKDRAEAALPRLMKKYMPDFNKNPNVQSKVSFRSLSDYHRSNFIVHTMIWVMAVLGTVILLIAAFNYVLISFSSLPRRAKTVGVHKCNGASNGAIFSMFFMETALIVLFSVGLAFLLLYLFRDFVETTAAAKLASLFTLQTLWVPGVVALLVFLLAGVIPAWLFSSIPVTQVFRRYTERKALWKRSLLFSQFIGVSFILGFLMVVLLQYHTVISRKLGYDPTRVVMCWGNVGNGYENAQKIFESLPMVEDYAAAHQVLCYGYSGDIFDVNEGQKIKIRMDWVGRDFIPMMKIKLLEGHNFTPLKRPVDDSFYGDNNELIVNREFVRQAGWKGSAIGHEVMCNNHKMIVTGVMDDYPVSSAYEPQSAVALVWAEDWAKMHYLRLKTPFTENLERLNGEMKDMFPTQDIVFFSLEKELSDQYIDIRRFRDAVTLAGIAILFITLMGLIGYVNDEVNRRSKEIAIRKVNGAEAPDIIRLIARDIVWTSLPAVVLGSGFSYLIGKLWLNTFAEQVHLGLLPFGGIILLILLVLLSCVLGRTWHIANENPVNNIKSE